MSLHDTLKQMLAMFDHYNDDPSELLENCKKLFQDAQQPGEEWDPRVLAKAQDVSNAYALVSSFFLEQRYAATAASLLIEAWNEFAQIQADEKYRIYRAGIASCIAQVYLVIGDDGAAMRWALLTQADDMLGEHGKGGGLGKHFLLHKFGMPETPFQEFNQIARNNLAATQGGDGGDWSQQTAFAEDTIVQFVRDRPEYAPLLALPSSIYEFPVTPVYFSILNQALNNADPNSRGRALEYLASYLFMLIPGFLPRPNVKDRFLSYETDLVVRNLNSSASLTSELFGRHFIVECKNRSERVTVQDVGYFLYRMRLSHAKFGVMFATMGITGNRDDETASYGLIRKAFHEDKSTCVIISKDDLQKLEAGSTSFLSHLLKGIELVPFG